MENVNKTSRNKTLSRKVAKGDKFLSRAISVKDLKKLSDVRDITVCADTLLALDELPREHFDLIIADPPYNLKKSFDGNNFSKLCDEEYEEYTRAWLSKLAPLLRDGGSIYVCCDWRSGMIIGRVLSEFFTLRNRITWQREKGRGARKNWKMGLEDIWFATKGNDYKFNLERVKIRRKVRTPYRLDGEARDWKMGEEGAYRDTCPSSFWDDITVPFWSMSENTAHPTQKPEKLIAKIILASSDEGDTVLDPFLGSGTTSVVAKKLGRHYVGIEQSETYCSWAEERLERAETDKTIQGYDGERFYERNSKVIRDAEE